ncbi:hypothetical protein VTK26DRAFT_6197 [Humicola hyalothermophila]
MSTPLVEETPAISSAASAAKEETSHGSEGAPTPESVEHQATGDPKPNNNPGPSDSRSEGEYSESEREPTSTPERKSEAAGKDDETQPPLPNEPVPEHDGPPLPNEPLPDHDPSADSTAPPLPAEPAPEPEDDGWEYHWNPNDQSYWFYNRFTGVWQQENPRVPSASAAATAAAAAAAGQPPAADAKTALSNPTSIAGGYNPAIHGDYDENAWYARGLHAPPASTTTTFGSAAGLLQQHQASSSEEYATAAFFNRHTGRWQTAEQGAERHSDEAKSRRQMRAYFDVDAAANMHDGRSLKAERAGIKPSRSELRAFKERRRAKKEEKRRAWLRD